MRSLALASALLLGAICAGPAVGDDAPGRPIHRVVTTLAASGKAVALIDSVMEIKKGPTGAASSILWATEGSPADLTTEDRATIKLGIQPPKGGTVLRIVDFAPETPAVQKLAPDFMMKIVGADAPAKGLPPRHPMMHRTRTVDYAIVMSGEIDMLLDDSEVHLKAGDVLVQQATNHACVNRGTEPCRIAFVLIDSQEP